MKKIPQFLSIPGRPNWGSRNPVAWLSWQPFLWHLRLQQTLISSMKYQTRNRTISKIVLIDCLWTLPWRAKPPAGDGRRSPTASRDGWRLPLHSGRNTKQQPLYQHARCPRHPRQSGARKKRPDVFDFPQEAITVLEVCGSSGIAKLVFPVQDSTDFVTTRIRFLSSISTCFRMCFLHFIPPFYFYNIHLIHLNQDKFVQNTHKHTHTHKCGHPVSSSPPTSCGGEHQRPLVSPRMPACLLWCAPQALNTAEGLTNHRLSAGGAASCGAKDEEVLALLQEERITLHSVDEEQTSECTWRPSLSIHQPGEIVHANHLTDAEGCQQNGVYHLQH